MATQISRQWVRATVRFTNRWGGQGSGFLVSRTRADGPERVFFVTNKFLVKRDPAKRANARYLVLHLNVTAENGGVEGKDFRCPLSDTAGAALWREPDGTDVDVYVADVTGLFEKYGDVIVNTPVAYNLVAGAPELSEHGLSVGEDIIMLGFPDAFSLAHPGNVNLPVVRQGVVATALDGVFETREVYRGLPLVRRRQGFLIDVGTMRGSGGGPVVLRPHSGKRTGEASLPAYLLGIVAETKFTMEDPVKFSGLGFAFGSDLLRDTIDKFFA